MAQKSTPVTVFHSDAPTTDPARLTSPVTIRHNPPPTIKRPENPEIVTILHSPDSPAQVRMGIILIENESQ
jgi:hypothetical protein